MFKLRCSRNSKHTGNFRIGLKSIAGTEPHPDEVVPQTPRKGA